MSKRNTKNHQTNKPATEARANETVHWTFQFLHSKYLHMTKKSYLFPQLPNILPKRDLGL